MSYTMEDFIQDYFIKRFSRLTPEERRQFLRSLPLDERRQFLRSLPLDERLADLSPKQIQQYLDQQAAGHPAEPRKRRPKT